MALAIPPTAVVPGWAASEVTASILGATLATPVDQGAIPEVWLTVLALEHLSRVPGVQGNLRVGWNMVGIFVVRAWWAGTLTSFENRPGFSYSHFTRERAGSSENGQCTEKGENED